MTEIYRVDCSYSDCDDTVVHYVNAMDAIKSAADITLDAWRVGTWAEARVISIRLSSNYSPEELACRMLNGYGYTEASEAIAVFTSDKETKYYDKYRELVGAPQEA